jgi:hypothetical protein
MNELCRAFGCRPGSPAAASLDQVRRGKGVARAGWVCLERVGPDLDEPAVGNQ